jgi:hypothetical protein
MQPLPTSYVSELPIAFERDRNLVHVVQAAIVRVIDLSTVMEKLVRDWQTRAAKLRDRRT